MERKNNYLIAREEAKRCFLNYDQQELIDRWALEADEASIWVRFFGECYRIDRATADVRRMASEPAPEFGMQEPQAGFEEVLSIFDLLCYPKEHPIAQPRFAQVNSLDGCPAAAGVSTAGSHDHYARLFARSVPDFIAACEACHGVPVPIGDIGYEFSVFADLKLQLKFYEPDDEFPPQLIVLWNANALSYARYETLFYIMGFLLSKVSDAMEQAMKA